MVTPSYNRANEEFERRSRRLLATMVMMVVVAMTMHMEMVVLIPKRMEFIMREFN
jgi:hypothetical protein